MTKLDRVFMIAWKADYGYTSSIVGNLDPSNIIYTDIDKFWGFPGTFNGNITKVNFTSRVSNISQVDNRPGSPQNTASELLSIMGSEYYYIYNVPMYSIPPIDGLSEAFASVKLMCPNLWENRTMGINKVVHLKTLKLYIVYNTEGNTGSTLIFNEDGTYITSLGQNLQMIVGTAPNFLIYRGEINKESVMNPVNYLWFASGYWVSYGGYNYTVSSNTKESKILSSFLSTVFNKYVEPDLIIVPGGSNPYEPGGPSTEGGGGGSFDDSSDQIIDSTIPTISSANTGFTRIYNPTLSQVQDLARYLWTDISVIETIWNHIKQFFENPMEAIIGFNLVPVPVPNGGTKNFALMYIDTGVSMTIAASQFVDVDCGTLELPEYYGSALDYSPNTKVSCFLPFIGNVSLNTDEVMGRTLQVKYRVDICSGSCVAKIAVDGNFIYQYSGHCAINIPLSAADFSTYVNAAISVGKLVGTALAAGAGLAAASATEDAVQQTNQIVTTTQITNTARNPATGRQITTGTTTRIETREAPADQSSTQASFSGLSPQNIANTVGQVMTSKPHIEHSGGFSGNSGYLGVRRPYLIIERPNMCMPENFQTLNGFPSMITLVLGECTGFTRIQQVQLTGLHATNPEQAEILQLLKSGVIL